MVALRSITRHGTNQQQMDGVMVYLGQHGQHVNSLGLMGDPDDTYPQVVLWQLPQQLQLSSLQLQRLYLQLQPGDGCQGVLGAAACIAALKQLRLSGCHLCGGSSEVLAVALAQLPAGLEHLTIRSLDFAGEVLFPAGALQHLPHLTHLELAWFDNVAPDEVSPALQSLQALTRLAVLKLEDLPVVITTSMLTGMQHLTRLELSHASYAGMLAAVGLRVPYCRRSVVLPRHGVVA